LKEKIRKIFFKNRQCYGYRRIYGLLRREGIILSEKVIRRIMSEEGLRVPVKSHKKYSSYQGEITSSVENLIKSRVRNVLVVLWIVIMLAVVIDMNSNWELLKWI
ncbi:IS3 family transposase, partial [Selenomonas ruminantium]|uniref:IS3 family transposase n=1 Tax=Selenomonas ruminantium TaxID=971 RepID=UPI001160E3C7